jgi:hypothetical protein
MMPYIHASTLLHTLISSKRQIPLRQIAIVHCHVFFLSPILRIWFICLSIYIVLVIRNSGCGIRLLSFAELGRDGDEELKRDLIY